VTRSLRIAAVVAFIGAGCGGGPATSPHAAAPVSCAGQSRSQLDCSAEFQYDTTSFQGGLSVAGIGGFETRAEQKALHEIAAETQTYIAQARRLCDEYNKCVVDRDTYALRSENLRRRIAKVPELVESLNKETDSEARKQKLAAAYTAMVPESARTELELRFSVLAQRPGEAGLAAVDDGSSLPTGSRVAFSIQLSRRAHVYLFQKTASGAVRVLFPEPRIHVRNPVSAGTVVRIPQGIASFRVDDSDVGEERVYLVASLLPLAAFVEAAERLLTGSEPTPEIVKLTTLDRSKHCRARALVLEIEAGPSAKPSGCTRTGEKPSLAVRTEAADDVIAAVFRFVHPK
jgi:hypothetical protein